MRNEHIQLLAAMLLTNMDRVITYSLLAHIHNTGTLVDGLIDIFVPLVKRAISMMNREGIQQDKSIITIKDYVDKLYELDIPIPVLKNVLTKVANQINTSDKIRFQLFHDSSFSIKDYVFEEFEETIEEQKKGIAQVERAFEEFCKINGVPKAGYKSIFDFIEKNKRSLSRYLIKNSKTAQQDFSTEAQFVEFFKAIPKIYDFIRKIYLGSILSSYLEYKTENLKTEVELLFDTNFLISLIDLNTPESTHTCKKLIEIVKGQGFKLSVLKDTIEESQRLLFKKAEYFEAVFLQRRVNPEDIYNACERRSLSKTDIERISDNLEATLNSEGIQIVSDTTKLQNVAKFSHEFEELKKVRNNHSAALHDAVAIYYVRDKRKKKIVEFENVNCWFVNNTVSDSQYGVGQTDRRDFQPEVIKVDDLLNILWLSNPNIKKGMGEAELADIGITALISVTLSETLPKASIIKELDDNIRKYADERLTDKDILRVATRITKRQLKNIESLNELAKKNSDEFINKLLKESEIQKFLEEERVKKLEDLLTKLDDQNKKLGKVKESYEHSKKRADETAGKFDGELKAKEEEITRLKEQIDVHRSARLHDENHRRKNARDIFIQSSLNKWRRRSWIEFWASILVLVGLLIWLFSISDWSFNFLVKNITDINAPVILLLIGTIINSVFFGIIIKSLIDKYRNHANIKAYRESIKVPENLNDLMGI